MCIFIRNSDWYDFFWENIELLPKYIILCNLCETSLAWMSEELFNQICIGQMLHKCDNYYSIMCIRFLPMFDYDFLFDCLNLMHDTFVISATLPITVGAWNMWACLLFLPLSKFFNDLSMIRIVLMFYSNIFYVWSMKHHIIFYWFFPLYFTNIKMASLFKNMY